MKVYIVYFLDFGEYLQILRCFKNKSDSEAYLAECISSETIECAKEDYGIDDYELY